MKIRRCPACAQLIHFEPARPFARCWNCRALCDFSRPSTLSRMRARLPELPSLSRAAHLAPLLLSLAAPIAALMLLVCNALDIRIVHDPLAPFLR